MYEDHASAAASRHLVLRQGDRRCYLVFRMDRRKRFPPVFASVLHVGDRELFHRMIRPLAGFLAIRHRALAVLAELRIVGRPPAGSIRLIAGRPKMYRSPFLTAEDIDYFYSELVSVPW